MKKSNAQVLGLGTLALVSSILAANQAYAVTAGGSTIHNHSTLTYAGGSLTASVDVAVQTVAAQPAVVSSTADQTVPSYGTANYAYTVTSTSNGSDTFALALLAANVNTAGAPGTSFLLNGNPVTALVLGATATSQASGAGVVSIPAGSQSNLSVNDVVKIGGNLYTITAVTSGTPATTNTSTGLTTPETPSTLTLAPVGAAPAITAGSVPAGTQIGEQVTLTQQVVASAPAVAGSSATHTVSFTATSTATDLSGATVVYSSASNGTNTVTTVITADTTLSTLVRNATRASGNSAATGAVVCNGDSANPYFASGVTSKPGDTLQYCMRASLATGQPVLTAATLQDSVPVYTSYVPVSTTLNGAPVADVLGASPLSAGMQVNSPGDAVGTIQPGKTATVTFQATVQ